MSSGGPHQQGYGGLDPLYQALYRGHSDIVEIIVKNPGVDFSVKTKEGETLAQHAVKEGVARSVEILAEQEKFDCWNVADEEGDTMVMRALKKKRPR